MRKLFAVGGMTAPKKQTFASKWDTILNECSIGKGRLITLVVPSFNFTGPLGEKHWPVDVTILLHKRNELITFRKGSQATAEVLVSRTFIFRLDQTSKDYHSFCAMYATITNLQPSAHFLNVTHEASCPNLFKLMTLYLPLIGESIFLFDRDAEVTPNHKFDFGEIPTTPSSNEDDLELALAVITHLPLLS